MAFVGSPFVPDTRNEVTVEGNAKFSFPDGQIYKGEVKDGQFHGKGTVYFTNGGKFEAIWQNGLVVEGKYTFPDGLEFEEGLDWKYLTESDRRFHEEKVNGIRPAGKSFMENFQQKQRELLNNQQSQQQQQQK